MDDVRVAAIAGSLRDGSYTRAACRRVLGVADGYDRVGTDLIDLRALDLPVYDNDRDGAGEAPDLLGRVAAADAVLLGSPNYHGSYASPLKNALDYCGFDEFENTTVGLLTVAGGSFPTSALDHMRIVARALNAWVLPHQVAIPNARDRFADEGDRAVLTDEAYADRVDTLGHRLVEYANIEPDPPTLESEHNVGAGE